MNAYSTGLRGVVLSVVRRYAILLALGIGTLAAAWTVTGVPEYFMWVSGYAFEKPD